MLQMTRMSMLTFSHARSSRRLAPALSPSPSQRQRYLASVRERGSDARLHDRQRQVCTRLTTAWPASADAE